MRQALAYIRISVVGNRALKGTLESPELQRQECDRLAHRLGVTIVDEIRDLNRSGGTLTRPGLQEALTRLKDGEADGIIVARSDRASRNVLQGLGLIEELAGIGKWIAAADGSLDTTDANRRMATIMFLAMGERQLATFREQSAVVHEKAIVEKGRQMGPAGFGYARDEQNRLIPDAERAEWARKIFELRADGWGWVALAKLLDQKGVRTPNGAIVNQHMLRRMVRRRVYVGEASHGKHIKTGAHPAIVDEALWAAANRSVPAVASTPRIARVHPESLMRGLYRCAGCRYVMKRMPQRTGGGYRWACRTRLTERTATHRCDNPALIRAADTEVFDAWVIGEFFDLAAGAEAIRAVESVDFDQLDRDIADLEALLDELSSLEQRRKLGAQRWNKIVEEARTELDAKIQARAVGRARKPALAGVERATLEELWGGMTFSEQQHSLRSVVQAVMVSGESGPAATRARVLPVWVDVDLPRRGVKNFRARPWQA